MDLKNFTIASIHRLYSLEISITNSELQTRILLVEKRKGQIQIVARISLQEMEADIPILLSLAGKDIISKIEKEKGDLASFRSNLREDDFMIQTIKAENFNGMHLIRKETFEQIIQSLTLPIENIIGINLGGFVLHRFAQFLFLEKGIFNFGGHNFEWDEGIKQYDFNPKRNSANRLITLGEESIPSEDVAPFVIAFLFLSAFEDDLFDIYPSFSQNKKNYLFQINTGLVLKYGLAAIFILAILNFAFFSWYMEQKKGLENKYQTLIPMAETNKKLKAENLKYGELFDARLDDLSIAYMADQFVAIMPDEITLEEMELFPPIEQGNEKNSDFELEKVWIKGKTQGPEYLHLWTSRLQEFDWVKEAEVSNYTSAKRKGNPEFTLIITI